MYKAYTIKCPKGNPGEPGPMSDRIKTNPKHANPVGFMIINGSIQELSKKELTDLIKTAK